MNRILRLVSLLLLPLPSAAATAGKEGAAKEWTFLLFLNGNNNLDSYGKLNINQMEEVGSSDQVNLVVQWASLENGGAKRLYVTKDADKSAVTSPVVQDLGNPDMGDARVLEEFIRWGVTAYPAKHYFIAVWDHGSGWRALRKRAGGGFHVSDISWDDNTGHSITTKQLGEVMNSVGRWLGRKIDIYGSDACLMGMAEVAGEMAPSVDYFLGSEDLEPGEGWPYKEIFAPLVANPAMSARELSARLTEEYAKSYNGGSNGTSSVTMSAFDLGSYGRLVEAIAGLGNEIARMPSTARGKILAAAKAALSFDYDDYVDLGDFLKKLGAQGIRDFDQRLIDKAHAALASFVVLSRNTGSFGEATGASLWIPKDASTLKSYLAKYRELRWESDTHWSGALQAIAK